MLSRFGILIGSDDGRPPSRLDWPITCPIFSPPPASSSGANSPQWSRPPLLLIFGVLSNGLNQLQLDIYVRLWVRGVILLIALIINIYALRLRDREA